MLRFRFAWTINPLIVLYKQQLILLDAGKFIKTARKKLSGHVFFFRNNDALERAVALESASEPAHSLTSAIVIAAKAFGYESQKAAVCPRNLAIAIQAATTTGYSKADNAIANWPG